MNLFVLSPLWRFKGMRLKFFYFIVLLVALSGCVRLSPPKPSAPTDTPLTSGTYAPSDWRWFKVDLHSHSALSSDAQPDLGVLSRAAAEAGYNAVFVTDHNGGSSFHINNLDANHMAFEDTYTRWELAAAGSPGQVTNELVTSPVKSGTQSLRLGSTSSGYAESFVWTKRGPNLRSGDIMLTVSIFPTRIDAGSSAYVSVSLGGDASTSKSPHGYTTTDGVIHPGKSTILVWQLGDGVTASSDPYARVITYDLGPYTLNAWNSYTINVSNAFLDIPVADRPIDYNGVGFLKMAVASNGGSAEAYFDAFSIDASAPVPPGEEFVYRNSLISNHDTETFRLYPSIELGQRAHTQRFNFGISSPNEFVDFLYGTNGIVSTQSTGYLAQLNHPGVPGGAEGEASISNQGYGADIIEVNEDLMAEIWDSILMQDVVMLGARTTDTHRGRYSKNSKATFIYAPSLEFDTVMRSIYEGRSFLSSGFTGEVLFSAQEFASGDPYPARYPVFVSGDRASTDVQLTIPSGASDSYSVRWISEGVEVATDSVGGSGFDKVRAIPLADEMSYVRAELRSSSGSTRVLSQPIFFVKVAGMPADKAIHVDTVETVDGQGYTREIVQGITGVAWEQSTQTMALSLTNPAGSLVEMTASSIDGPTSVVVDGALAGSMSTFEAFDGAMESVWFYDGTARKLHLKVLHGGQLANATVTFTD